jgi:hypothetical protein
MYRENKIGYFPSFAQTYIGYKELTQAVMMIVDTMLRYTDTIIQLVGQWKRVSICICNWWTPVSSPDCSMYRPLLVMREHVNIECSTWRNISCSKFQEN